ncbi:hypothetical protein [Burkholderia cepacia]|uniref:RiboL-PSP-HEPN domain-containing protein n=1 Tax=Burkholderia cepacia GG4 TaxID=1009846 RepID=A0A9W3PD22_BURCE|nr:hypothetical protein [Burkholderia cepacia]AFQ52211.1 hypothetical protein GEM_5827 [Burkholderia cepacia GG4]
MGWNDHLDDNELSNLPPEAYGNVFDVEGPFDPCDTWLETASRDEQIIAVRGWFLARFCDPAEGTPYNGREGGYQFVHGGPYDPADEIPDRFANVVDDDVIEEVVDELHGGVGDEWAPIREVPTDDYYDDRFDLDVDTPNEPLSRLRDRIQQARQVLTLTGSPHAKSLTDMLVFSNALGVLESFLWETAEFWFKHDDSALQSVVTKLKVFSDEPMKLGDIFTRHTKLREHVLGYLQNLVWHRWDSVVPIFQQGLGIRLPSVKPFEAALLKRHDIVHRCGQTKTGAPVTVTQAEIGALFDEIEQFAIAVNRLLSTRPIPNAVDVAPDEF